MINILGVDTGGTFTDFVLLRDGSLQVHKVLSTPQAPEQAILAGIVDLGLNQSERTLYVIHGSTVATNAVLENKGVTTAFITNRGMGDMLSIGRQARKQLYNLQPEPVAPPVPQAYCLETGGRIAADGSVLEALTDDDLNELCAQIDALKPAAVAINLLFSFLDDSFERRIEAAMAKSIFVSRSSKVLPEHKEYERGIATWLNAAVGPIVSDYLHKLCRGVDDSYQGLASVSVMQSSGGTIAAEQAADQSINMLLSGPAGGMAGAQYVAAASGRRRLLTFDMGGTSSDVALIDGALSLTTEGRIAGYPVAVPMVDMHTIGAGGGSIASVDAGGLLRVGPESAGADPGPACYGKGGRAATVSDANLILGRLQAEHFLGGAMRLDVTAACAAMQPVADALGVSVPEAALGVIRVVNENMVGALKVMSVQRGIDPKQLCLVSFGGAGALHVCALASALNMRQALVPIHSGVLSALGMLVAPRARYVSRGFNAELPGLDEQALRQCFDELAHAAEQELIKEGATAEQLQRQDMVDIRYRGQSFSLTLPWCGQQQTGTDFHAQHERRYGHRLDLPLQLVNARVTIKGAAHDLALAAADRLDGPADSEQAQYASLYGHTDPVPVYRRAQLKPQQTLSGPALICDTVATTYVDAAWSFGLDDCGSIVLEKH